MRLYRFVPLAVGAACAFATALTALPGAAGAASGPTVVGLTQNSRLVTFSADEPGTVSAPVKITGLNGTLVGIDYRPLNGLLYGVVRDATGAGQLVTIDTATGATASIAPLVGATGPIILSGTEFGVDFNPAADALRITSNTGQDLRALPSTRAAGAVGFTFVDGPLAYPVESSLAAPAISGSAYINNDNDPATGTALFNIDSANDVLTNQNPPNNGTQAAIGPLGVDADEKVGLDIRTAAGANTAYVSIFRSGRTSFGTVSLSSGAVSVIGTIGSTPHVIDIAVPTS